MPLGDLAVRFSPDGSFFTTGDSLGLKNSSTQLYDIGSSSTVAVWTRPNSLPANGTEEDVFRLYNGVGNTNQLVIGLVTSGGVTNWFYRTSDSAGATILTLVGTSEVEVGRWYHVLGCKNDIFTQRLFVNGADENTTVAGVPATTDVSRSSSIGLDGRTDTRQYDGDIYSIALWNIAIAQESVEAVYSGGWKDFDLQDDRHACYNEGIALRHWWRLGQGITVAHSSGDTLIADWVASGGISITEQVGTIEQSDVLNVGEAPTGTSVDFDASTKRVLSMPSAVPIGLSNEWTVSAWIKPREVLTVDGTILCVCDPAPSNSTISISQEGATTNDPLRVSITDAVGAFIFLHEYNDVLAEDEWQHIAVTWDGVVLSTYLDGALLVPDVTSGVFSGSMEDASRTIIFGANNLTGPLTDFWNGKINHVGMWRTVLSSGEIRTVASQGQCLDLRYNVGNYVNAEFLENYFKPGEDILFLGRNFIDMNRSAASRVLTRDPSTEFITLSSFMNTIMSGTGTGLNLELHKTANAPAGVVDILWMMRGMVTSTDIDTRVVIDNRRTSNTVTDDFLRIFNDTHYDQTDGFRCGSSFRRRDTDMENEFLSQNLRIIAGTETARANHCGIVGFDLSELGTEGVDFEYAEPSDVGYAGYSADTDEDGPSASITINETGDHLVFWSMQMQASGILGNFGWRLSIDGTDPYNTVSGGRTNNGFAGEYVKDSVYPNSGACVVNFGSTGSKTFKFILNVDASLAGSAAITTRARFFVIPVSKFNSFAVDSIGGVSSTTSESYQSTNFSLGPITTKNKTLIMFSGPYQPDSGSMLRARFVSDGLADLTDGDEYGGGQAEDRITTTTTDTLPIFNFVLVDGLFNETISVEFRKDLAAVGDGADEVILNCQDDGSTGATSFLIALELAVP